MLKYDTILDHISEYLDWRLCYVDRDGRCYFVKPDLFDAVFGDDWDDAPYWSNSGPPYEQFGCIAVYPPGGWSCNKSPWSAHDINRLRMPWLVFGDQAIFAGTTLQEFVQRLKQFGETTVYLPVEI